MKQTMLLKLVPTPEQHTALLDTMHAFNGACDYVAQVAYVEKASNKPEGAVIYDERVMSFKGLLSVSLLTLSGRALVPFQVGGYQAARMDAIKGQADLLYRKGVFYLAVSIDTPTPTPDEVTESLGVAQAGSAAITRERETSRCFRPKVYPLWL
jgi:putative transposase